MLPLVLSNDGDAYDRLVNEYRATYNEEPSIEQKSAWRKLLDLLRELNVPNPIILEYPIFFSERADIIFVGKDKALVVEAKGWRKVAKIGNDMVEADGELHIDPCYQLENYVTKLNLFHSSGIKFEGVLFLYNTKDYTSNTCKIVRTVDELRKELSNLTPGSEEDVRRIVEGKLVLNGSFIDFVKKAKGKKIDDVARYVLNYGYGLSEEQMIIMNKVLEAVRKGEKKNFLIRGSAGAGKSLLAVTIFLQALSEGYLAILSYKNNRLLNAVRRALGKELSGFVMFYSTGRGWGIGESKFPEFFQKEFGGREIDIIVFDEAQRMTESIIKNSARGRVNVYFYDDDQVLIGNEAGTRENFLKYLKNVEELELTSNFRAPKDYLEFVRKLLNREVATVPKDFDFRIFDDICDMLNELERRWKEGRKVALICSFTESEGDSDDKTSWDSIKNIRIGYPLQSGFDLYKNVKCQQLRIKWLMDERTEYPAYWEGKLDPLKYCSSVYGAQGFETDYIGVVWGRDMVWRDEGWVVNPDPITDYVGGRDSLKNIAKRSKKRALELLLNRYYVMLTRGIRGVYVFFEDEETREAVKKLIKTV